jgi:hypothetical protein
MYQVKDWGSVGSETSFYTGEILGLRKSLVSCFPLTWTDLPTGFELGFSALVRPRKRLNLQEKQTVSRK